MRKLAAIMFTDIVGYTTLMGEDETKALKTLQKNRDFLKPRIEKHNGEWLKEMGDGTLSCFTSAVDAVNCAKEIQLSLKEHPDLTLRIGIHIGDVVFEEGDVFGDGVNVASRIEPLAEPGGICVSGRVYDDIHNKPDIGTVFIGEQLLKHVKRPIKVYALTGEGLPTPLAQVLAVQPAGTSRLGFNRRQLRFAGGIVAGTILAVFGYLFLTGQRLSADEPIPIAVVDFINETNEPELDGLSGMLITALEQSHRLSVLTRSRMFDILKQLGDGDVEQIDEQLGKDIARHARLDVLIIASIRKLGALYIIDLKALEPDRDEYLFTAQEEGTGQEHIPVMLDKLAERTRIGLKEKLHQIEATSRMVAEVTTPNLEAYQHYFQGEEYINKLRFDEAIEEFQAAIALDSTFGLAYYRLAYAISWEIGQEQLALIPIEKAYALIDHVPEKMAFLVRAEKAQLEEGMAAGIAVLKEMEQIYPEDKEMLYNIGDWSYHIGEYGTSEEYLQKVLDIDPTHPRALQHLCWVYRDTNQIDSLLQAAQHYVDATDSREAHTLLVFAWAQADDLEKAILVLDEFRRDSPNPESYLADLGELSIYNEDYAQAESYFIQMVRERQPTELIRRGFDELSNLYILVGKYREALTALDNYIELARGAGDTVPAAIRMLRKGHLYRIGWQDMKNSWREVQATFTMDPSTIDPYYNGNLAIHLAYHGEYAQAESLITRKFGDSGTGAASFLAVLASVRNDCDLAVFHTEPVLDRAASFVQTYTWSELAQCQIRAGHFNRAVTNLEQLRAMGIAPFNSIVALYFPTSHYLLGIAYEGMGDTESARSSYAKFLELWKEADDDLIILKDAKSRYEKLNVEQLQSLR